MRRKRTTSHEEGEKKHEPKDPPAGVLDSILADAQQQVAHPDFEFFRGTSLEDVRATLARTNIDHVIMGGGIPLETRLEMVRNPSVQRHDQRAYEEPSPEIRRVPAVCSGGPSRTDGFRGVISIPSSCATRTASFT
jgi:hypothetical protein